MKYTFTAVFTPKEDKSGYLCRVPDLPGCISSGSTLEEAIHKITDAASVWLVDAEEDGEAVALPTPQDMIIRDPEDTVSVILIDTIAYRAATDTRAVRKNVSLPAWMANLADKKGINCSQVLQEGLLAKFGA
ncbi:MAG: type II toxin-antitoxin system HicB family antitoxin [Eubacteriales bacterium]|nr:type II toxin-antitoxin system HicB family antitoxin [Eubacteriales bacterium]